MNDTQMVPNGQVRVAQFGTMPRVVDVYTGMALQEMLGNAGIEVQAETDSVRVNGQTVAMTHGLEDGDTVVILPKIVGG